jgi:hypothetical protein
VQSRPNHACLPHAIPSVTHGVTHMHTPNSWTSPHSDTHSGTPSVHAPTSQKYDSKSAHGHTEGLHDSID